MKQWMLTFMMTLLLPTYAFAASHGDHDKMSKNGMQEKATKACQMKYKDDSKKQAKCIKKHKNHDAKAMMKDKKDHSNKEMMKHKKDMQHKKEMGQHDKKAMHKEKMHDKMQHNKMAASDKMMATSKHTVNVNKASAKELTALPGIGMKKANAIVEYRTKHGMFKNDKSLMKVPGLGNKSITKIKDHLAY